MVYHKQIVKYSYGK